MKLRDEYSSLEDFCAGEGVAREELISRLSALGFAYDENTNAFR